MFILSVILPGIGTMDMHNMVIFLFSDQKVTRIDKNV